MCFGILFEWYRVPKKMPPKKILLSFFLHIFHIKTKRNIVYKYLKTEIFQETQTSFSKANALNIKYLWTFTYNNWGVWGIIKLSNPWLQESGMLKKHLHAALWSFMKNIQIPVRVRSMQGEIWTLYTSTLVKQKPFLRILVRVVINL